jgi:hypothetical protein
MVSKWFQHGFGLVSTMGNQGRGGGDPMIYFQIIKPECFEVVSKWFQHGFEMVPCKMKQRKEGKHADVCVSLDMSDPCDCRNPRLRHVTLILQCLGEIYMSDFCDSCISRSEPPNATLKTCCIDMRGPCTCCIPRFENLTHFWPRHV